MSGTAKNPDMHLNGPVICLNPGFSIISVLLLLIALSFSGCVEQNEGHPDDLPDIYEYSQLTVTSEAFENGTRIPVKYTCDGENINPSIEIGNISADIVSLLLIVDDPDAPSGTFTHWLVWNIDPQDQISENDVSGVEGMNSAGQTSYIGPCPPSGTHRYFFKLYGLDTELDIEVGSQRNFVDNKIEGHVIAYGELIGLYSSP